MDIQPYLDHSVNPPLSNVPNSCIRPPCDF